MRYTAIVSTRLPIKVQLECAAPLFCLHVLLLNWIGKKKTAKIEVRGYIPNNPGEYAQY